MNKTSSIILTIHNKAYLLPTTLTAIRDLTDWRFTDIIFVLDGCSDYSAEIVNLWTKENPQIISKMLFADDVYETRANNIGCKASNSDYVIIVQDDQIADEISWNTELISPFKKWPDVFAVSANAAHHWKLNKNSIGISPDGWSDLLIHHSHANKTNTPKGQFVIRDCVNRGPLAINRADLASLCYLDERFAPLDSDDHDLCYRAWKELKKVVGYYNVDWYSKPEWGGTRDEQGKTKQWVLDANVRNAKLLWDRHNDVMGINRYEVRSTL